MVLDTTRRTKFACKGAKVERLGSGNENAVWFSVHPRIVGNIRYFCHLESVIVACGLVAHHSFLRRWRGSRALLLLVIQAFVFVQNDDGKNAKYAEGVQAFGDQNVVEVA